jgi:phenylpropionate dioxygenase-like ring-hydroxylating dioxygenase large terminal subunit
MNLNNRVRPEEGFVGREIFADPAIYERELERIFARCWLYLGHTSQLQNDGDFFTTYMAEDQVVVTRTADGSIRAFLNSCRHRGVPVCRTEKGNAKSFTCPYHGWSYATDGKLIGVPGFRHAYHGELDRAKLGLVEVGQLDTVFGMIFATWDPQAPSLANYLGGMMPYLERMMNRLEGGVIMIPGVQKWTMQSNWKMIAENFIGDSYHVPLTHGSVVDIGYRARPTTNGHQINPGNGHGFGSEEGGLGRGEALPTKYMSFLDDLKRSASEEFPASRFIPIGHGGIFPNLSFLDNTRFRLLRIAHPRGPHELECHAWCFVDAALPEELREEVRKDFILSFGPSGMFEQEDGEMMSEIDRSLRGFVSRRQTFNYEMGLRHEVSVKERFGLDLPGDAGGYWSEINQRRFYQRWRELLEAEA